ncbi:TM2 domain-containing protein [Bartonella sp. MM73XJBT.G]|uniref:TM2 domain-containing protein n=1 Tax=Bartonella sp. MM73XJBT.G TaxID=3019097 RepID=UPI00235F527C|nr:TM2 domain-containing protein [Bartonella sp. MM73XJBT.G]
MKGTIIGQDQGDYFISGADGKRYQFASWDWLGKKTPKVGDTVDFVYEDNVVKSVFPLLSKSQSDKSRLAIALVCWFFGWLGIHRFMAGKVGTGIVMLLISLLSIPFTMGVGILLITGPWSFIDFIVILSGYFRDENGDKIINW